MPDKDKIIADLQAEIALLKSILSQIPGNFYWKSIDDCYLGCNLNNARNLGLTPEQIIGKKGSDFLPAELAKKVHENDLDIMQGGKEISFDETGINSNGKEAIFHSTKTPLYDEFGKLVGLLGVSIDITHQKKMEKKLKAAKKKAEVANKAKSQFLAMISHEIRVPLTSILGFITLLQNKALEDHDRKIYLEYLKDSGNYLLELVNKILDFSKLESNKNILSPMTVNLKKVITDTHLILAETIRSKKLFVSIEYDENVPDMVIVDKAALQQILINLINNAIKFTDEGKIIISIKCIEKVDNKAKIQFSVADTGMGIATKKLKKIFQAFYQVEDIYTRNARIKGTGLGLAIASKLVSQLGGGKIFVESKINQGSTFSFVLTLVAPLNSYDCIVDSKNELNELPKNFRVLLVEDDLLVQIVHQKMLSNLGCVVDLATTAAHALELMSKNTYQVILTDIGLPDVSGFHLIKQMRKNMEKHHNPIPIIVLSGFSSREDKKRYIETGANAVMIKPVSEEMLKAKLMWAIEFSAKIAR